MNTTVTIPTLTTGRLTLRAPRRADFDAYRETLMSERARHMGGWPFTGEGAWGSFTSDAGSWLVDGFGYWSVERRADGRFLGLVGLGHPPHFPELELGWAVQAEAEGHGHATEAARAVLAHAFGAMGVATLVSYVDPANARSIAVAGRLGGRPDPDADRPDPEDLVFRYPDAGVPAP